MGSSDADIVRQTLFRLDYPYERTERAVQWFDNCGLGEEEREKIGRLNALRLFKP